MDVGKHWGGGGEVESEEVVEGGAAASAIAMQKQSNTLEPQQGNSWSSLGGPGGMGGGEPAGGPSANERRGVGLGFWTEGC